MTTDPVDRPGLEHLAAALVDRHLRTLTPSEFLRAARALSARYVQGRQQLAARPPLDSAGKRAAFAVLYGPIHFETTCGIVDRLQMHLRRTTLIVDLGCGTGAAAAGWVSRCEQAPQVRGVDRQGWAVTEAGWTWRTLGMTGRAKRGDLVSAAAALTREPAATLAGTSVLLAWAVNELEATARAERLGHLLALGRLGVAILVIEPVASRAVPWWEEWARTFTSIGGRADIWQLPNTLPAEIRRLDREAGFERGTLAARSLALLP